jgi:cell division protein ZapA
MSDQLILLNLVLADRTYRIKVQPKDEEVVRRTAKVINDRLIEYKTQFAGKDMQDYLAMVLIWFATEQNAGISNQINTDDINDRLKNIEKLIDATLEKEQ